MDLRSEEAVVEKNGWACGRRAWVLAERKPAHKAPWHVRLLRRPPTQSREHHRATGREILLFQRFARQWLRCAAQRAQTRKQPAE